MNRYSLLKFGCVPFIAYFFYWAIFYEMVILQQPIQDAFSASYRHWILLIALVGLEVFFIYKERKLNENTLAIEKEVAKENPWAPSKQTKKPDKDTFRYFMRNSRDAYSERIEGAFDSVWRSRIHKRIFFKVKRILFGSLAILYFALALMSLGNLAYFIVFLITAYAFLENLLLAKHYQFIKRRVKENESERT